MWVAWVTLPSLVFSLGDVNIWFKVYLTVNGNVALGRELPLVSNTPSVRN